MRFAAQFLVLLLALPFSACSDDGSTDSAPTLEITAPRSGELVSTNRVRIAGTASGVDEVDVNGSLADVVGGQWEVVVPFDQGEATATAVAGSLTREVDFEVDSVEPMLELTSPERALYIESESGTTVTVSGMVSDGGSGLETLKVGEQTLDVADDGSFSAEVSVAPGYQRLTVTAIDLAGNDTDTLRGIVVGTFDDPTAPVSEAFSIFVKEETLQEIGRLIETVVTPEFVLGLVEENLDSENITFDSIDFDPIDATIDARTGFVSINLVITNVTATGSFSLNESVYPVTVDLARAAVVIDVTPTVLEDGTLDLEFSQAELEILDEDLTYQVGGDLTQDDTEFVRDTLVGFAQYAFGDLIANFVLAELYDPDVLKRQIELLGRTLTFELAFESVRVLPDGILAEMSVTMPDEQFVEVREVPGALANPLGPISNPETDNDITFTTHRVALDHIVHGVWRSGLLHQELTGSSFAGFELPIELTSESLATVLDNRIDELAPAGTPLIMRLRPQLPPFIRFDGESNSIRGNLGEFVVEFVLENGAEEILVASTALFVDLEIGVNLDGYVVSFDFAADVRADIVEETDAFDLDDEATEALFEEVGAFIPAVLSQSIDIAGVSELTWVRLENPDFSVHGTEYDYLTASLSLLANPEGFAANPAQ